MKKKRKRTKRKLKLGRIIVALLFLVLVIVALLFVIKGTKKIIVNNKNMYVSSDNSEVLLYTLDEEDNLIEDKNIYRGTKVISTGKNITKEDKEYTSIKYEDKVYYINKDNLSSNIKDVVKEKERYVRTSVTVYENEKDSKIKSFIKKGNKLDIEGYDNLNDNGTVNMYKIKSGDTEGWVYSKYLTDTEDKAKEVYNENSVYDNHKDRKYPGRELHGGSASTLDYYPYERVEFKDNPLLKKAKSIRVSA